MVRKIKRPGIKANPNQQIQIMKKEKRSKRFNPFFFSILLFIPISCTNQHSSNNNLKNLPPTVSSKPSEHLIDTTLRLEFKSMIRSIFEDSKGNFWLGSDREGVCKFDGKSFTYFTTDDGLSNNQIRTIQEDQHGNIWFGTGDGICSYDQEKITIHVSSNIITLKNNLGNKWSKASDDIWIGSGNQENGIYKFDGQNFNYFAFPILAPDHDSFSIPGPVTGTSYGKNKRLWIANYGGVLGYDGKSFLFINERNLNYHVRSILEDRKGNLWIGNNGIGVLRYDGKTTINFTKEKGLNDVNSYRGGIISPKGTLNHVFSIEEDHTGNIWFGDRDSGAWRYDGESFTNYTTANGLTNMFVRVIYTDKKGGIWIGMDKGGLCKFNGSSFDKIY